MRSMFSADPFGGGMFRLGQVPNVTVQEGGFSGPWGGSFFAMAPQGGATMPIVPYAFDGDEETPLQRQLGQTAQAAVSLSPEAATDYSARVAKGLRTYVEARSMVNDHPDEAKAAGLDEPFAKLDKVANLEPAKSGIDWTGITDALKARRGLTERQMAAVDALTAAADEVEPKLQDAQKRVGPPPSSGMKTLAGLVLGGAITFGLLEGFGVTNVFGGRGR